MLHSLEQTARGTGLYVNSNKTEFISFNQHAVIWLNGKFLKLGEHFIYLSSNITSTESDIDISIGKEFTDIDMLKTMSESFISKRIK